MADVVSVGNIGAVDILRLSPSDDMRDEKIHGLLCPSLDLRRISNGAAFNKWARYRGALYKRRNQQITLISTDEKPFIKLSRAAVDVILIAAKQMDTKDVTRN